ncbi:MAG: DUF2752 domain-containing protein [Lachnospiraceae bacterium]|nr:DUF2752 domain-containing protein [Lachnospiraceae bacterium]
MIRINKNNLWMGAVVAVFVVTLAVFIKVTDFSMVCPIYRHFHLYCPGCGTTRMIKSLMAGDIYQAFRWNPFMFFVIWTMPVMFLYLIDVIEIRGGAWAIYNRILIIILAITVIFTIIRNTQLGSFMAPTGV